MDNDREEENEAAPAEGVPLRARLKVVAHYALLASPLLALLGIILAVTALVLGRSAPQVPDDSAARIASLSASLNETKNELESLKFILTRERAQHAEERRETEERDGMIVQHVTRLQTKQKISPTLEEQLKAGQVHAPRPAASAPAPAAPVAAIPAQPASAVQAPPVTAPRASAEKAMTPAPVTASKPVVKPSAATEKTSAQVKSLKEAIEKFNAK